jgi:hypothetical protein
VLGVRFGVQRLYGQVQPADWVMSEADVLTALEHLRIAAEALRIDPALFYQYAASLRPASLLEDAVESVIQELAIRRNQRT